MLLGYNKSCCDCPPDTSLPDFVEVTFSDLPSQIAGPDLCKVTVSSCYGSGANVRITEPRGTAGPISAVSVEDGGSGYAVLGREQPSILIYGTGSGITATPTFASESDKCGLPYWAIETVSVTGGKNYVGGESLFVVPQPGSRAEQKATLILRTAMPTVTASVPGGSGASLSVTLSAPPGKTAGETPYVVQSVSVNNGGSGYKNGTAVTFSAPGARLASSAAATAATVIQKSAPTLTPYVWGFSGSTSGTGAVLSATLSANGEYWEISNVSIISGGIGYQANEYLWYLELASTIGSKPPYYVQQVDGWWIESVDANGSITALGIDPNIGTNGLFYYGADTGIIESVSVTDGGQYDSGVADSVAIADGGRYYGENEELPALVSEVTISISQTPPSNGTGAKLTAVVGDDPANQSTFGRITGVAIDNGGDGYLAFGWVPFPGELYDGFPFIAQRTACACCRYDGCDSHGNKSGLSQWPQAQYRSGTVNVAWGGQSGPHHISLTTDHKVSVPGGGFDYFTRTVSLSSETEDAPYVCDPLSFTARGVTVGAESAVATVVAAESVVSCADILSATTIKATVESADYFRQVKRQMQTQNGTKYWAYDTQTFRGADFAGDYELTKETYTGGLSYKWKYIAPEGDCLEVSGESVQIELSVRLDGSAMECNAYVGMLGAYSKFAVPGPDDSLLKPENWFECLPPQSPPLPPQKLIPQSAGRFAGCGCRLENLSTKNTVGLYVPPLPGYGDAAGAHVVLSETTVSEAGSLVDPVAVVFSLT